jgi:penicillin-binding protein 1A
MTGGSLPAMTWRAVMAYAHQGIELKDIPGVPPAPAPATSSKAKVAAVSAPAPISLRPTLLTRRGADALVRIERMMEDASRALSAPATPVSELPAPTTGRAPVATPQAQSPRPVTELPATPPVRTGVGPVTEVPTDPTARPVAETIDAGGAATGAGAYASANRASSGN